MGRVNMASTEDGEIYLCFPDQQFLQKILPIICVNTFSAGQLILNLPLQRG